MTTQLRHTIQSQRNDRQAFAARARAIARWHSGDGDVAAIEESALLAETQAARLDAILKRFSG